MIRETKIKLEYQPPIPRPPVSSNQMREQYSANDAKTVDFWKEIWIRNMETNRKNHGPFVEKGLHKLYKKHFKEPVILMGAGPSLKHYAKYLNPMEEDGKQLKGNPGILVISALHNFAYLTDLGVHVDYWATLDGGEIVIDEMFDGATKMLPPKEFWVTNLLDKTFEYKDNEGRSFKVEPACELKLDIALKENLKDAFEKKILAFKDVPPEIDKDFYREKSKGQKLIAYVGTNPRLWENWKGETIWTHSLMPDPSIKQRMDEIEKFEMVVSSGGNVLGASLYIAKAIFGCNPCIFMGADFSFSYDTKFHSFDSKYDVVGQAIKVRDIYGNSVQTWASYYGFAQWFNYISMAVPGIYINCSDGCMGAYEHGNIISIIQKHIVDVLEMYRVCDHLEENMKNITTIRQAKIVF